MDKPVKPLAVTDIKRRSLRDLLGESPAKTDEELPSMAMAVLDASHRSDLVADANRNRTASQDALDGEMDRIEEEWKKRRERRRQIDR